MEKKKSFKKFIIAGLCVLLTAVMVSFVLYHRYVKDLASEFVEGYVINDVSVSDALAAKDEFGLPDNCNVLNIAKLGLVVSYETKQDFYAYISAGEFDTIEEAFDCIVNTRHKNIELHYAEFDDTELTRENVGQAFAESNNWHPAAAEPYDKAFRAGFIDVDGVIDDNTKLVYILEYRGKYKLLFFKNGLTGNYSGKFAPAVMWNAE